MATLATTLKTEIRRLAAREVQKTQRTVRRLQRQVKSLKALSRAQKRTIGSIERKVERVKERAIARGVTSQAGREVVAPEQVRDLRSRLQMTRVEFARLLDVSPGSIFGWETGRTVPRGVNASRILEVERRGTTQSRVLPRRPRRKKAARRRTSKGRRRRA